jgi:hypothetical protein
MHSQTSLWNYQLSFLDVNQNQIVKYPFIFQIEAIFSDSTRHTIILLPIGHWTLRLPFPVESCYIFFLKWFWCAHVFSKYRTWCSSPEIHILGTVFKNFTWTATFVSLASRNLQPSQICLCLEAVSFIIPYWGSLLHCVDLAFKLHVQLCLLFTLLFIA